MKIFFSKQRKLDDLIVNKFSKRVGRTVRHEQLIKDRLLSVYVEMGEFLEEKDHQKKLFEAMDTLHFMLSSGLAFNIQESVSKYDIDTLYAQAQEKNYNDAVINFQIKLSKFVNTSKVQKYWSINHEVSRAKLEKKYYKAFLSFFDLCKSMGYTVEDIQNAYEEKNRENYYRQETNY